MTYDFVFREYIKSKLLISSIDDVGKYVEKYIPEPYADEMRGIAQYYNVSLGKIVAGNLAYDISAWYSKRVK